MRIDDVLRHLPVAVGDRYPDGVLRLHPLPAEVAHEYRLLGHFQRVCWGSDEPIFEASNRLGRVSGAIPSVDSRTAGFGFPVNLRNLNDSDGESIGADAEDLRAPGRELVADRFAEDEPVESRERSAVVVTA